MDTCHTSRFNQCITGSGMFYPCFTQISSYTNSTSIYLLITIIPIITHIKHDISILQLHSHTFCRIMIGRLTGCPRFPSIPTPGYIRKRHSILIPSLGRKDQSSVFQCNSMPRCRCIKPPFRTLCIPGYIYRFTPCPSFIGTFSN